MIDLFHTHSIYRPFVVARVNSTNENVNWFKLFVPQKTKKKLTLLTTGRLGARHRTWWTLSQTNPQFKVFRGWKNLTQTFWYRLNSAANGSPIILLFQSIDCYGNLTNYFGKSWWGNCRHNDNSRNGKNGNVQFSSLKRIFYFKRIRLL